MISDALRAKFQADGYTPLHEYHERDLVRVCDGVAYIAGRLADDATDIPEGLELLVNARRNKWWARDPQGNVVLVCIDPPDAIPYER